MCAITASPSRNPSPRLHDPRALNSPNGTRDAEFLANYAYINLSDALSRVPGISQVQIFGAGQYAMRIWVKPDQLAKLNITVPEIINAVNSQNTVNPAGKIGGRPSPPGQEFTYTVRAQGRLVSEEEFGNIVLRATPDGSMVRLKGRGPHRIGRGGLRHHRPFQRQTLGRFWPCISSPAPTPSKPPKASSGSWPS